LKIVATGFAEDETEGESLSLVDLTAANTLAQSAVS
jgi:hypothetical protein